MDFKVHVDIPALDRFTALLTRMVDEKVSPGSLASQPASPTTGTHETQPAEAPKPRAPRGSSAKAKEAPAAEPAPADEVPEPETKGDEITKEALEEKAREFIGLTSPAASRKLLDENGFKGKRLGDLDKAEYPALYEVFVKAITDIQSGI